MRQTKKKRESAGVLPTFLSTIILGSLTLVGIIATVNDDDVSCPTVRATVIQQHKVAPSLTKIPYKSDTPEQEDCDVNRIQRELIKQDERKKKELEEAKKEAAELESKPDGSTGDSSSGTD